MNKVLFWDFDGTLVHSNSLWSNSVLKVLHNNVDDCKLTLQDIRSYLRTGFTWHTPEQDFSHLVGDLWWEHLENCFTEIYRQLGIDPYLANDISRKVKHMILDASNYTLYDDAISTLEACTKLGYKNYILSNNYPELQTVIAGLGISSHFTDYIISAVVGYDKPRCEIFDYALTLADYPEKCFMIGDNPIADIEGANSMGIPSILVHTGGASGANYSFQSLAEILNVL